MGVDITHLIRHDFHDVKNKEASVEYVDKTVARLRKELHLESEPINIEIEDFDNNCFCVSFDIPDYDVEVTLRNGFWQIESFFHYCQVVMHQDDYFWLRSITFDIARALGQNEAWYAEEYYTWNCEDFDIEKDDLDQWLSFVNKKYNGRIPEFDVKNIMDQGDVYIPEYESIYHDSFIECRDQFENIQRKLGNIRLLGLHRTGHSYRCERNGRLMIIDVDSLKPVISFSFDGVLQGLNGGEFVIVKDGLSAVFNPEGKQLTPFAQGTFKWRWAQDYPKREIFNEEAGITITVE